MDRSRRTLRAPIIVISAIAVSALVVVVGVGIAYFGWGSSGSPASSKLSPPPNLSIMFAANSTAEVNFLLTSARPYVAAGDSFDLVSGSPETSGLSVNNVNRWAQELEAAFPGDAVYAHTAGLDHYSEMSAGVGSNVSGVLYDYEPNFEPEFTFNFTQTVSSFENATTIAHAHGLQSVGYPIGRMLLETKYLQYDWNYATLGRAVDQLVIQTQTYCVDGPSEFASAVTKALGQYATGNTTNVPTFQITIGNSTTDLPNGVTAGPAYDCAEQLIDQVQHSLYVWWDQGGESNLLTFLQDLGRS